MAEARVRQQASAYKRNRAAAFSTNWAAQSAVTQLDCPPEKAHVVGIGPNFTAGPVRRRDWATPRFLFAGREWSRKNGPAVVEAFARVRELFPAAELHLAGHLPPIDRPGIVSHGHLDLAVPADRDRMLELWSTATCCVVPSRFEPAGIIYVEAMHAGIPAIGTTQGGAPDIIGDAGRAVDPEDPQALTAAMLEFCDPIAAATAGQRARRRSELYSWTRVAAGLQGALGLAYVPRPDAEERRRRVE
nr:glycosyltransferase family 4 protein [Microbacterium esteraromaticum]